jgi:tetratricopeptide (TPR) repeat protein
VLSQTR